jgi:hypothetical protein
MVKIFNPPSLYFLRRRIFLSKVAQGVKQSVPVDESGENYGGCAANLQRSAGIWFIRSSRTSGRRFFGLSDGITRQVRRTWIG